MIPVILSSVLKNVKELHLEITENVKILIFCVNKFMVLKGTDC